MSVKIYSSGSLVSSGAIIENAYIDYKKSMHVSSGGTANSTTVNSGGYMDISSGGVANSTTVNNYGEMNISSGGVANNTTVNSGGWMKISSGGTATEITALDGARLYITVASNTYIQGTYNGSAFEMKDAYISGYTVNSYCWMDISSGGAANSTTVNSKGDMNIYAGGMVKSTMVNNGGFLWLQGTASNTVLSGNAYGHASMTLASGGSAYDTDVNYRGVLQIVSSAKIDETKVNSGGSMVVSFGGVANNTTINSDGFIAVYSGGTANNLTLKIGGQLGGFSFNEEKILSSYIGAETEISDNVTINGSGMDVADKGVIDNVVVNSVATMYVSSGGTANNVKVNSRGVMRISSGGTVNNMIAQSGARIHMTVAPYTYVQGKYNNSAFEMKDGKLSGYTVDSAGYVGVTFGGTATETIVNSFGALHISSLAVANDNIVNANGSMVISSGGVAHNTVVNSRGYLDIYSGTHKGNLQIANGAIVSASQGGVIDFTVADRTVNDGYLINNLSLISGNPTYTITVSDNQTDGIYKLAQGAGSFSGSITIGNGTINYGSITVNGEDFVYNNTTYSLDQVDGNLTLTVSANAAPPPAAEPSVFIYSSGTVTSSGTVIDGATIVNGGNNSMHISSGGTVNNTTVNYGRIYIYSGGTANSTTLNLYGSIHISNGGTANHATVNVGGSMHISSGGTALEIVENGGHISLSTGANVTFASNTISGLTVNEAMTVHKNTIANNTTITSCYIRISSGGIVNSTTLNNIGDMYIHSAGVANSTTVNSRGSMFIRSGGIAYSTIVSSGGYIGISSEGIHRGTLQINDNAKVSVYEGGVIDFTVAERTASDGYLINNLSLISGTPTYTITVSDNQTDGIYKLAQGAGGFSGSITIGDGTINYGSITVNGEDFVYNDITYSLDQVDGNLTLTVEKFNEDTTPPEKPQASANITTPTKRNVTVTAVFSNDSVVREYSLDGENWLEYENGVVFEQNGTVYFRGKDAAGNISEIAVYNVENIELRDLTLSIYGNPAKWTNNDVSLTAISNRQAQIQYSFDGQKWLDGKYVVLTENKTVYFRAVDNFGNTAEKTVYVTKIDKVAPDTPLVSADVTENTNSAVTVTAVYSSDSVVKEYSFDGENWLEYERGVVFDENGTVYFRGTDAAGNISETAVYNVDNIDKEGSILSVCGNPTEWTNKDVVLTAFASDGIIEYFDGQKWVVNNSLTVTKNGTYRFRVTDEAGNVTETSVVVDKIDKIAPTLEISGNPVDWTEPGVILQAEASDGIIEYFDGQNWLASSNMTVYENGTYLFRVTDAAGNVTEKSVIVDKIDAIAAPQNLSGSADGVSWESDAAKFNFKLINGSGNIMSLAVNGNQLDLYGLLYGEYSAKVKSFNGTAWSKSIDISSNNSHITPQYFKSDADGADDVFFADSYSNWTRGYGASHVGSRDRWNGTGEVVELKGKLRIKNIYEGSTDHGTLVLTDYLCGDAVSADDIFSASPLEIQSVRLSQINEIFAGAGDDVIDMTSQRFEMSGSLKIHGGSGNDVIWANNGENKLFGDGGNDRIVGGIDNDIIAGGAGNDSLHGGGGNDIFVFGSDFGNDTVEQLANGKVTLIFESEKVKWNGAAYTDGKNSVTLSGDFEVEVRYGATPELAAIGAFDNFTTEKIFEDKALIA